MRAAAAENGWKMSMKVRVNPTAAPPDFCTIEGEYADISTRTRYVLSVSLNENNEPVVILNTVDGPRYVLKGKPPDGFHQIGRAHV